MNENPNYEPLSILDNKCSALLSLSSVVLAVNLIPARDGKLEGFRLVLTVLTAVCFLVTSLLSLAVIWVDWKPTERTVRRRTGLYKFAVVATACGLLSMATTIIRSVAF